MGKYYQKREFKKKEWGDNKEYQNTDPIILEVVYEEGDTVERLIKRFLKKFKKARLMDEFRGHEFFTKPSDEKRERKKRSKAKIRRAEEERKRKEES